jgi:hypothetical protein
MSGNATFDLSLAVPTAVQGILFFYLLACNILQVPVTASTGKKICQKFAQGAANIYRGLLSNNHFLPRRKLLTKKLLKSF